MTGISATVIKVSRKRFGQNLPAARTLNYLAKIVALYDKSSEAEPLYREALALQGNTHSYPTTFYLTNCNLTEILHERGEALHDEKLNDEAIRLVSDASHWSVDDASTAELMGTFFEQIAKAAKQYDSADKHHRDPIAFAAALHEAQKRVRSQPQWSSPYYWAPFVLIGPPQ